MIDVVLFAKHWTPGQVKTRLAKRIGCAGAAQIARQLLDASLEQFDQLGDRRYLAFAPSDKRVEFQHLIADTSWQLMPQVTGSLGDRMQSVVRDRLGAGASGVLLLGSDSPLLSLLWLRDAIRFLSSHDLAIGPASDGGYYAIGFARNLPQLLQGIDWGTERVMEQTKRQMATIPRLRVAYLPVAADVDEFDDLLLLRDELRQRNDLTPALRSLQTLVEGIIQECDEP